MKNLWMCICNASYLSVFYYNNCYFSNKVSHSYFIKEETKRN